MALFVPGCSCRPSSQDTVFLLLIIYRKPISPGEESSITYNLQKSQHIWWSWANQLMLNLNSSVSWESMSSRRSDYQRSWEELNAATKTWIMFRLKVETYREREKDNIDKSVITKNKNSNYINAFCRFGKTPKITFSLDAGDNLITSIVRSPLFPILFSYCRNTLIFLSLRRCTDS